MGSFVGHVLPGSLFLAAGLWWLFHVVLDYASSLKNQGRSHGHGSNQRSWRRLPSKRLRNIPFEPLLKILVALGGICGELSPIQFQLVGKDNEFVKPSKFAHSSMYAFFALSGLVEILNVYNVIKFSCEVEYVVLALAFGVEGTLFAFHLHGRDFFDVRIHTLLYIVIYLAALVILLEACLPRFRRELFMARSVLVLTQGSWFWEIAFTIYGPHKWFVDAYQDLTKEQLMLDTEVITIGIMWHLLAWSLLLLFCCVCTSCLYKRGKLPSCCLNYGKLEKISSPLNGAFLAENELSLSDEEEILLKRDSNGNNHQSDQFLGDNIDEEA